MNNHPGLYREIELTTEITTATPHRLIQMLLENAIQRIIMAKKSVLDNNFNEKFVHLNKARDICEYLRLCLVKDDKQSRELAGLLEKVYVHCEKSLIYSAVKNDVGYLDEVQNLLGNIKEGWDGIASTVGKEYV